jgi:hypothetical protein
LHSYCHITHLRPEIGGIHLWVSGDTFPQFNRLNCDLVFVVAQKRYWASANHIEPDDDIVDSPEAFADHYRWYFQHRLQRRRRYTLKADPQRSFQPQTADAQLIDIVPSLIRHGWTLGQLRTGLHSGFAAKPLRLDPATAVNIAAELCEEPINLKGPFLRDIRLRHPELASPWRGIGRPSAQSGPRG